MLTSSILSVLLPALLAGGVSLVVWRSKLDQSRPGLRPAIFAWCAALGILVGFLALFGSVIWPPVQSRDYLFYSFPATAAAVCLTTFFKKHLMVVRVISLATIVAVVMGQFRTQYEWNWDGAASIANTLRAVVGFAILAGAGLVAGRRERFITDGAWWLLFGSCLAILLVLAGTASVGQICGVITAVTGGFWILHVAGSKVDWRSGAWPLLGIGFGACLLNGFYYADLGWVTASLLMGSVVIHTVGEGTHFGKAWVRPLLIALSVAILLALVGFESFEQFSAEPSEYEY